MKEHNEFWHTEKGKSIIKLICWGIFILLLIVFTSFNNKKNTESNTNDNNNVNEVKKENYKEYSLMINDLLAGNYEYKYVISKPNAKIVFSGIKAFGEDIGYRETSDKIIKYYINSEGIWQINLDNKKLTSDLYLDIDSNYLNIEQIFSKLNSYLYEIEENFDTRTIIYKQNDIEIAQVITDLENIKSIYMVVDDTTYEWNFAKIGECSKIEI